MSAGPQGKASLGVVVSLVVLVAIGSYLYAHRDPHSVTLTWNPPDGGAQSYNVYRGTTSGGPYTKIGSAPETRYIDKNVPDGSLFYYVVTSVVGSKESVFSSEIKVEIP